MPTFIRRSAWVEALVAALLIASCAQRASAQEPRERKPKGRAPMSLEEVAISFSSNDEEELRTALEAAAMLPAREVLPLIEERVRSGLPPVLLDVAFDSLLLLNDAGAESLLCDLARHRRPGVRARSLDVLAQIGASRAPETASQALGDSEPTVRKAAAEALGRVGGKNAFARVLRAFELEVEGAARALGQVARVSDVPALIGLLERYSPDTLLPTYEALLARRDIPLTEKQQTVAAVAALQSDEARSLLRSLSTSLRDAPPELRRSLAQGAGASR